MNRALPPGRGLRPYDDAYEIAGPQPPVYEEEELDPDLRSLWGLVVRNRWLILAFPLIALGLAWWYNSTATPYYRSSTTLRINDDGKSTGSGSELNLTLFQDNSAIETEMAVLSSRMMAEMVAESLDLRFRILEPRNATRQQLFESVALDRRCIT